MARSSGPTRREFARQTLAGLGLGFAAGLRIPSAAPGGGGRVAARVEGPALELGNDVIAARWSCGPDGLRLESLEDRRNRGRIRVGRGTFALALDGGVLLDSAALRVVEPPRAEEILPDSRATRASERIPGRRIVVALADSENRVSVRWRATLREGSHYLRQDVAIASRGADVPLREVVLVDLEAPGAGVAGTVAGSPIVAGSWFFAVEHPLSQSAAGRRARASLSRALPLKAGQTAVASAVFGAARAGQLRRDFLAYLERERARPYAPFLHYNSWYDLGYFTRFDEAGALGVIDAFGRELHEKRGVVLDSFLFDDGWDDRRLWGFHDGFPRGFAPLRDAAARYGAAPGVWLSPWGGYGKPREERLAFAKKQGFETNEDGLALSGPVYYERFREVCLDFVRRFGVNQFKIDGTGSSSRVVPGSAFGSDFEAAIALIEDLRAEKPGLFVNLTTGTYPSPAKARTASAGSRTATPTPMPASCSAGRSIRSTRSCSTGSSTRSTRSTWTPIDAVTSTRRSGPTSGAGRSSRRCMSRRGFWEIRSGTRSRRPRSGRAATRRRSSTRTGSAAIPRGSSPTGGRPGRAAGRS